MKSVFYKQDLWDFGVWLRLLPSSQLKYPMEILIDDWQKRVEKETDWLGIKSILADNNK